MEVRDERKFDRMPIRGYIIVNFKTKQMRVVKTKPKKPKAYEIVVKINLDLMIPKSPIIEANAEVELSQAKLNEIVMDSV